MSALPQDNWLFRLESALKALRNQPAFWEQILAETAAFFAEHPQVPSDALSRGMATILIYERHKLAAATQEIAKGKAA